MKTAFIFKPSKHWKYCGGLAIILADNFEEAQSLWKEQKLYKTEEDVKECLKRKCYEYVWDIWVLAAKLNCPDEKESRLVIANYNWA